MTPSPAHHMSLNSSRTQIFHPVILVVRMPARSTNPNSCSTGPALWEFFKKSAYYREKGPGVQGKRWPKYRYCFSCLKVRGGSLPSKCQVHLPPKNTSCGPRNSTPRRCQKTPRNSGLCNSGKEKAHKHKQIFTVTARVGGGSPNRVARGLPTGGQGSKVYVLCAAPKEHKHFRPGTRPGGFGYPVGRIGDRGDREIVYVPNVYAPFLAPSN